MANYPSHIRNAELPVKTDQCILAFTIPLSQREFFDHVKKPEKDFARNCCSSWSKYRKEVVEVLSELEPGYKRLGVQIIHRLKANDLNSCFTQKCRYMILIAHWYCNEVEFYDQMLSCTEFASVIPEDYDGIIDLCVCTPEPLAQIIKDSRPDCTIRYSHTRASLSFWLQFYNVFFHTIHKDELSPNEAFEKVTKEFLNQL